MAQAFASTQAAWRFYANDRLSLRHLAQPLLARAREAVRDSCSAYALVVHDWSLLHYNDHPSKRDRIPLSQKRDLGYNLQSALLVSDSSGRPLAPLFQGLQASDGVHSSQSGQVETPLSQLDGLAPVMGFVERLGWDKPCVHIIDAEADSVGHFRYWQRAGYTFLVRADPVNRVRHGGRVCSLQEVGQKLRRRGAFRAIRTVEHEGHPTQQWVAQAQVTLTRPAKLRRQGRQGPSLVIRGEPLRLRLVVSQLRNDQGQVVACWYLLTNLPAAVPAVTVALWYYWRWDIESYYKLLKGAGHQLEHWQQETAEAVARRLLVASMACVVVWQLARSSEPAAEPVRQFLVRLSGRQMQRGRPFTEPALLAGLWVYVAMLEALKHYDLKAMQESVDKILANPTGLDSG